MSCTNADREYNGDYDHDRAIVESMLMDFAGTPLEDMISDFGDGPEADMSRFCGCEDARVHKRVSWCEQNCAKFGGCCNVTLANDIEVIVLDGGFQ